MSMTTTPRRRAALASTALATVALVGALAIAPAGADQPADRGTPPPHANGGGNDNENGNGGGNSNGEADNGNGEAPGNRGTVKIHEVGTPADDRRNEPHVCDFEIVGFGFADDANLVITIEGHGGPNAGPDSWGSTVTADQLSDAGDWVVDGPTLADGMYKLYVENTTAPGGAKQKVFKVDCPEDDDVVVDDDDDVIVDDDDDVVVDDDDDVIVDDDDDVVVDDDDVVNDDDVVAGENTGTVGGPRVLGEVLTRDLATAAPVAAVTSAPAPQVAGSALARTGAEVLQLAAVASALLVAGGALVRLARRRALA